METDDSFGLEAINSGQPPKLDFSPRITVQYMSSIDPWELMTCPAAINPDLRERANIQYSRGSGMVPSNNLPRFYHSQFCGTTPHGHLESNKELKIKDLSQYKSGIVSKQGGGPEL